MQKGGEHHAEYKGVKEMHHLYSLRTNTKQQNGKHIFLNPLSLRVLYRNRTYGMEKIMHFFEI